MLPVSAWITQITQISQLQQNSVNLLPLNVYNTYIFTGWVILPRLAKYKNKYTYPAYKRLFTSLATKKCIYSEQNFTQAKKNYPSSVMLSTVFSMSEQSWPLTIAGATLFQPAYPPHHPHAYTAPIQHKSNRSIMLTDNIKIKLLHIFFYSRPLPLASHPDIVLVYTKYIFNWNTRVISKAHW